MNRILISSILILMSSVINLAQVSNIKDSNHYVGELYGGGVLFYIDHTGKHGLICSLIDVSSNEVWSNSFEEIGVNAKSKWNGKSNTMAIINQNGNGKSAASICVNYKNKDYGTGVFSDWYLPAIDELNILYNSKYEVNQTLEKDNDALTTPIIDFVEGLAPGSWFYWSSTEDSKRCASYYSFSLGFAMGSHTPTGNSFSKKDNLIVRAVRSF